MRNWFISKVAYEKMLENGMQKRVVEPYLVDALSYTEAEARTIEELRPYITGEFTIADITRKKIAELFFNDNGDRFYEIKIYFITLEERHREENCGQIHSTGERPKGSDLMFRGEYERDLGGLYLGNGKRDPYYGHLPV